MSEEATETAPVQETAPVKESATQTEATAETKSEATATPSIRDLFKAKVGDNFKSFEKYKDDDALINGIMSAQQMLGKKGDIPGEDADDETKAEFWKKLGADKLDIALPEFGEEFGDMAKTLPEYYGGIKDQILEIAKEVIPKSGDVNEMLNGIMNEFIKRDAEATKQNALESKQTQEEMFKKVAAKTGMSTDQLRAQNEELIKRYGWTDETHIAEVIYELSKATTNSTDIRDSYLNNTSEGLDAQIAEISASDVYLRESGPKHDLAVKKLRGLLDKRGQLEKKS